MVCAYERGIGAGRGERGALDLGCSASALSTARATSSIACLRSPALPWHADALRSTDETQHCAWSEH